MIYEVCIVWDNDFFMHEALSIKEAYAWADQYSHSGAKARIWRKRT